MTLKCNRTGFIRGIPARDLTDAEVEQYGDEEYLIGTGLYYRPQEGDSLFRESDYVAKYTDSGDLYFPRKDELPPQAPESRQTRKNKRANQDGLAKDE